jgi:hypothetical protein
MSLWRRSYGGAGRVKLAVGGLVRVKGEVGRYDVSREGIWRCDVGLSVGTVGIVSSVHWRFVGIYITQRTLRILDL